MIPAFIVLLVIACALGGYIAVDVVRDKKKKAAGEADKTDNNAVYFPRQIGKVASAVLPEVEVDEIEAPETKITEVEISEAESAETEIPETDDGKDDEITRLQPVAENGKTRYIVIRYSKSFQARLIQSDGETKRYYSELKNKLLSYDGVKNKITWKCETFGKGRRTLFKLRFRGKALSLCFVGNADDYADTKYRVEDLAEVKAYASTPCMYRIKNDRRLAYAIELSEKIAADCGLAKYAAEQTDYVKEYPYEETDALIERKLIKVLSDKNAHGGTAFKPSEVREKVTASEADTLMKDEVAASLIERSDEASDRTKTGIVNIDTLSQYFISGETVTLDEIKKRVKGFNKQTTFLKVLARGTLDKPLTVEADSFSLQAVKMIVLTGGKVVKRQ